MRCGLSSLHRWRSRSRGRAGLPAAEEALRSSGVAYPCCSFFFPEPAVAAAWADPRWCLQPCCWLSGQGTPIRNGMYSWCHPVGSARPCFTPGSARFRQRLRRTPARAFFQFLRTLHYGALNPPPLALSTVAYIYIGAPAGYPHAPPGTPAAVHASGLDFRTTRIITASPSVMAPRYGNRPADNDATSYAHATLPRRTTIPAARWSCSCAGCGPKFYDGASRYNFEALTQIAPGQPASFICLATAAIDYLLLLPDLTARGRLLRAYCCFRC